MVKHGAEVLPSQKKRRRVSWELTGLVLSDKCGHSVAKMDTIKGEKFVVTVNRELHKSPR